MTSSGVKGERLANRRSDWGLNRKYRTVAGIAIEGIEDLTDIADGVA